jgi:hypothetical protein
VYNRRIVPLLEEWSDQLVWHCNSSYDAEGHGNPSNTLLGVAPLTVEEYMFSANHTLLIPFIAAEGENDNFGEEGDGARLYYHII